MGYDYAKQKPQVFSEDGQVLFLKMRDKAKRLLKEAGAFRLQELMDGFTGSTWDMIACVDRLVELGEILELARPSQMSSWSQNRVFSDEGYRP